MGEQESPALRADVLKAYGLQVYECDLNEVLRQSQHSGILWNATAIRKMITYNTATKLPQNTPKRVCRHLYRAGQRAD